MNYKTAFLMAYDLLLEYEDYTVISLRELVADIATLAEQILDCYYFEYSLN